MGNGTGLPGNALAKLGAEIPFFFLCYNGSSAKDRFEFISTQETVFGNQNAIGRAETVSEVVTDPPRGWIIVRDHHREETALCSAICVQAV